MGIKTRARTRPWKYLKVIVWSIKIIKNLCLKKDIYIAESICNTIKLTR